MKIQRDWMISKTPRGRPALDMAEFWHISVLHRPRFAAKKPKESCLESKIAGTRERSALWTELQLRMHFSYAGITCYYAILVGESPSANSDRAKPRASSRSRQPFKGQLNASLPQGGSSPASKTTYWPSTTSTFGSSQLDTRS